MEHRRHQPQVARDRALSGQQVEHALVDVEVAAVDAIVVVDHHHGELLVAHQDGLDRLVQRCARQLEGGERLVLELLELFVELDARLGHCQPTLPVTYSSVRLLSGLVKILFVSAYSTMCPIVWSPSRTSGISTAVMSDTRAACCMLCVTITIE